MDFLFQKMDLSLQNSGPFICEGGSSEPTEPPGYGPASLLLSKLNSFISLDIFSAILLLQKILECKGFPYPLG